MISMLIKNNSKFLKNCSSSCNKSCAQSFTKVNNAAKELEDELCGFMCAKIKDNLCISGDMLMAQARIIDRRRANPIELAFSHGWFDNWK